jgi:hypothetical protein
LSHDMAETSTAAGPTRHRRGGWALASLVLVLAAAYLIAIGSTHAALRAGAAGWSGPVPGKSMGLRPMNAADRALTGSLPGFSHILWASSPGGEVSFGFTLYNAGPVPVTLLGLRLRGFDPEVANDLSPAGALLGPGHFGGMTPFHPVTLGLGDSVAVALTERVVCDSATRGVAHLPHRGSTSFIGDTTSPVVVRYRALGMTMSQTLNLKNPLLVVLPDKSCK